MSCDTYDCEQPSVYRETTRRARKEHWCSACQETIRPGDRYCETFGVWDGDASTIRRCARCELIFQHLSDRMDSGDECPALRLDCGHSYRERWGEDPPPDIAALAFALSGEVTL